MLSKEKNTQALENVKGCARSFTGICLLFLLTSNMPSSLTKITVSLLILLTWFRWLSSWLSLLDTGFTSWFLWVEYAGVPYRLASCACQNDLAFFHFLLVHSTRFPLAWIMHTAHPINLQHALLNAQGFLISFLFGTEPSSTENKYNDSFEPIIAAKQLR